MATELSSKMEITNAYDKTAINNFLDNKADKNAVQASLTAVDTALNSKTAIAHRKQTLS